MTRSLIPAAVVAVLLAACDPAGPPDDIRGIYEMTRVGSVSEFPIYLGQRLVSSPAGEGFVHMWVVGGGTLNIYNTEYEFLPVVRETWDGVYYHGAESGDHTYSMLANCGTWNYMKPQVLFGAEGSGRGQFTIHLGPAEGIARDGGIVVPGGVVPVYEDGVFSDPVQEFEFALTADPLPETHCTCSGSSVSCPG